MSSVRILMVNFFGSDFDFYERQLKQCGYQVEVFAPHPRLSSMAPAQQQRAVNRLIEGCCDLAIVAYWYGSGRPLIESVPARCRGKVVISWVFGIPQFERDFSSRGFKHFVHMRTLEADIVRCLSALAEV